MSTIWKNVFFLVFIFLVGCSGEGNSLKDWMQSNGKKKVLSTTSMIGDLVKEIGGERVDSIVLIGGELDPHSYELVKGDDEKLLFADIVFYNGLGLEHGASLSYRLTTAKNSFAIGNLLQDHYPGEILYTEEGTVDPHIWMDIHLWGLAADFIGQELIRIDPEGEEEYRKNMKEVQRKLNRLDLEVKQKFQAIDPSKRYLVTSHDAFQYFAKRYLAQEGEENWKTRLSSPEGLAPEGEISPSDIKSVISFLRQNQVSVIFPESNVSQGSLQKIALDAKKMGLSVTIAEEILYGDTMPKVEEGRMGYIEMHKHNTDVITGYLQKLL